MLLASDYDKSKFLKSEDIGDREKKFRIKDVTVEEVGEKKEKRLVVWFTNDERGLILHKDHNDLAAPECSVVTKGTADGAVVGFV